MSLHFPHRFLSAALLVTLAACAQDGPESDWPQGSGRNASNEEAYDSENVAAGSVQTTNGGAAPVPVVASAGGVVGGTTAGAGGVTAGTTGGLAPPATPGSASRDAGTAAPTPPAQSTTTPAAAVTNPFVLADKDPFSTFAADVDTASYDIFLRDARASVLPAPGTVRLEEYVNYFTYDYRAPALTDPDPFSISLAATDHVVQGDTKLLRIGIQGAEPTDRKAANLVFLVDVSGSMSAANKLPLVKVVLKEALSVLAASDTVSIVTYASDTSVRLPPTPVSRRADIEAVIDALAVGGSTNGASGIALAYQQAGAGFLQDGINHVFLCTDGDFNVGISGTDALVEFIVEKRKTGVTLTALGFGDRNNDAMMNRVSNAGNGIYSVLFEPDQAIAYAHQRMLSSMIHIAKDMKLQVEFNPTHVRAYRLLGYETRAVADTGFRNDAVDGGEVGAGHRVTALYEIVLAGGQLPSAAGEGSAGDADAAQLAREVLAGELVRVKVRYKQPGAGETDPAREVTAALAPSAVLADAMSADADTRWAVAVASFAELLAKSPYVDASILPTLSALLTPSVGTDPARREFLSLFERLSSQIK
jgi:Ca-activated chloride channel family protein